MVAYSALFYKCLLFDCLFFSKDIPGLHIQLFGHARDALLSETTWH